MVCCSVILHFQQQKYLRKNNLTTFLENQQLVADQLLAQSAAQILYDGPSDVRKVVTHISSWTFEWSRKKRNYAILVVCRNFGEKE